MHCSVLINDLVLYHIVGIYTQLQVHTKMIAGTAITYMYEGWDVGYHHH